MLSLKSSSKVTLTGEVHSTSSQPFSAQLSREGRVESEGWVREEEGESKEEGGWKKEEEKRIKEGEILW